MAGHEIDSSPFQNSLKKQVADLSTRILRLVIYKPPHWKVELSDAQERVDFIHFAACRMASTCPVGSWRRSTAFALILSALRSRALSRSSSILSLGDSVELDRSLSRL